MKASKSRLHYSHLCTFIDPHTHKSTERKMLKCTHMHTHTCKHTHVNATTHTNKQTYIVLLKGRKPCNMCVKMRRNTLDIRRIPTLMTIDKVWHVLKIESLIRDFCL